MNCNPIKAVVSTVDSGDRTELLTDGTVAVNTGNVRLTPDGDILCADSVVNSSDFVVAKFCQSVSTTCREDPCVRKCCPDGYGMTGSRSCRPPGFDFNPQI